MKKIYTGKTKDVYELENGNIGLIFKDDVTGKDGVFDPGENQVGLTIEGSGNEALKITKFFYELFNDKNIKTHYVSSTPEQNLMEVKRAEFFGQGVEVICRFRAVGSFIRRYGKYANDGDVLDSYVEVTLKDDERQDPFITKDALEALNILTADEYEEIVDLTVKISEVVKEELTQKGLDLYDIKLAFGRDQDTGEVLLIDEISGGNMRVYKDGEYIEPLKINDYLFGK